MLLKVLQILIMLTFLILLNLNYNWKIRYWCGIKSSLVDLLTQLKGFTFVTTLVLVFKKIESENKTKYETFYSNSKAEIMINESDIDNLFKSIYTTIISNIQKPSGKGSAWTADLVIIIMLVFQSIIL